MKFNKRKDTLVIVKKQLNFSPLKNEMLLPSELANRFDIYPENKRRPVNKTLFRNDYFQLIYNTKENSLNISSRGDIVYSAIPYDTARSYIQRAAIQYLLYPEDVYRYLELHKSNIEQYLKISIFQIKKKRVSKISFEYTQAYDAIFNNPLFMIQILGRLLQHDETGPISANLPGKFLFSENIKTGISEYISEYLSFVVQLTKELPIKTDGKNVELLDTSLLNRVFVDRDKNEFLTYHSDINSAMILLPREVRQNLANSITIAKQTQILEHKPILRSKLGKELSEVRKNYIPHSVHPDETEKYFENVHSTENKNLLNVVSDIHTTDGKFPFINKNYNILVGDMSDSRVANKDIKGLYVIGNHELVDVLPDNNAETREWKKWRPFLRKEWFKRLLTVPNESWYMLPIGNDKFYEVVKGEIETRFPQTVVLNNSYTVHRGIRYIGLTIPVVLVDRKKEQQRFILKTLKKLLKKDYSIPTIIITHAPLFNELSMLSTKSHAYNKDYNCSEPKIEKLFKEYNIIGAIHGHHHIPVSSGQSKYVKFAEKEIFVVCSIYSKINTGFELMNLIDSEL